MIFTKRKITITGDKASIDKQVVLYRGDREIEVQFEIVYEVIKYRTSNTIEDVNASFGQLVIQNNSSQTPTVTDISPTSEGVVIFKFTKEMIDEISELGEYSFQIRLFDDTQASRITTPIIVNGIMIKEPLSIYEGDSKGGSAEVGLALAGTAKAQQEEYLEPFDEAGNYNETTWATGDIITSGKLNKLEDGITGVNQKVEGITVPTKTSELTNDSRFATETYVGNAITNAQLGSGGTSIDDTTTATNKTWSSSKIDSQIKEISKVSDLEIDTNNNIHLINEKGGKVGNGVVIETGKPTDEQVATVINQAIANGDIVAGGLTSSAQTLLISILRNAVFTSDQSASITSLQSELAKGNSGSGGGSETIQYVISNNLSNATTSNNIVLVNANASYTATITANSGYTLSAITVTMGGEDITNTAVSGNTITISSVIGNVVITVTTTVSSSSGGLIKNGLVGLFDYRTATVESPYFLTGWGNVAKAKFDSCEDYFVFNTTGTYTVDPSYGITSNWGARGMRQTSSPTTPISLNGLSNTLIGLVYGQCICNLYGMITTTNLSDEIQFTPHYVNSSGSTVKLASVKLTARNYKDRPGYSLYALTESDTELKLYINGKLMHTANSSECTDFVKWNTTEGCAGPHFNGADAYTVAFAIYNRPLSATEIVEATEYFKAMEVNS